MLATKCKLYVLFSFVFFIFFLVCCQPGWHNKPNTKTKNENKKQKKKTKTKKKQTQKQKNRIHEEASPKRKRARTVKIGQISKEELNADSSDDGLINTFF